MVEISFHSNACRCCGEGHGCNCTFPDLKEVERLKKQIKRLKKK